MVIPARARRLARISGGDRLEVFPDGEGRIVLVRLDRPHRAGPPQAKIVRRKGCSVVVGARVPNEDEIRQALAEFP